MKNPLELKEQRNGVKKLQGVFTLYDSEGFPIDMTYELAKENNIDIDWVEALTDAARQSVFKYDALLREIRLLEPDKVDAVIFVFVDGIMRSAGTTITDRAATLYKRIHNDTQFQGQT